MRYLSFSRSILTALFCMIVVFGVLILLWAILRLFSTFIAFVENHGKNSTDKNSNL
ncbi:MAG: OadG family protein [Anaerocolumna sp.]